jgi:hypothetical protein
MKIEKKENKKIILFETKDCSYESQLLDETKQNEFISKPKRTTVYLHDDEIAIAKRIGCGKTSNGIRRALEVFYKKNEKDA